MNLVKVEKIILSLITSLMVLFISTSYAFMGFDMPLDAATNYSLYSQCIYGWNLDSKRTPNILTVRTMGDKCYNTCQSSCAATFGITRPPDGAQENTDPTKTAESVSSSQISKNNSDNQANASVNRDLIEQCLWLCQQGGVYTGLVRQYNVSDKNSLKPYKDSESKLADPSLWKGSCSQYYGDPNSADYAFYSNNTIVKQGEKYRITLVSNPSDNIIGDQESNAVYMCGYKTVYIYPDIYTTDRLSRLWGSPTKDRNYTNMGSNIWRAKNASWYDTGIDAKDGDYLEIMYGGRYHYACFDNKANCTADDLDYDLLIKGKTKNGNNSWRAGDINSDDAVLAGHQMKSSVLYKLTKNSSEAQQQAATAADQAGSSTPITLGLKGSMILDNRIQAYLPDLQFIDPNTGAANYNDSQYRVNTFSGYLQGFSSTAFRRVGIRHYDWPGANDTSIWFDNVGGYFVNVIWKGCRYDNGQRLQYTIIPVDLIDKNRSSNYSSTVLTKLATDSSWIDIALSSNQGQNGSAPSNLLEFNSEGYVFFRIKPLDNSDYTTFIPGCYSNDAICASTANQFSDKNTYRRYNTLGQYSIRIDSITTDENWLVKIIKQIRTVLFGADMANGMGNAISINNASASGTSAGQYGIIQQIFVKTVQDSRIVTSIRALLVLYVAYTGLMFIMGMAQINQKEAVSRILRISIVVTLIGPTSWDFFYNNFFAGFIGGMNWLIDNITYLDPSFFKTNTANNFSPIIIAHFNDFLSYVTDNDVLWAKVFALTFSSLTGFILGVAMIVAVVSFVIAVVRATLVYIFSLLVISILIILSPLFISFILFNYTRQLFDAWVKQLAASVFQPALLFGVISLFNQIIIVMLFTATSFTICKTCWFGFYFFGVIDICFIGKYRPLISSHNPDPFSGPLSQFTVVVALMVIIHAMQVFCKLAPMLATRLINWMSVTGSASIKSISSPIVDGLTFFPRQAAWLAGLDSKSVAMREKMRKKGEKDIVRR